MTTVEMMKCKLIVFDVMLAVSSGARSLQANRYHAVTLIRNAMWNLN